ncbi:hypothetical protein BGV40_02490 [Methanosarcina sp. Ant1]|nr:hypothetical protein BGV40_02490 [Methanosarcina sp. Ant1]
MRMKTNFLNSIISIVVITMIVLGMTPGMASALDEQLGNSGNSNNGNSSSPSSDSSTGSSSTGNSSTGSSSTGGSSTDKASNGSSNTGSSKNDKASTGNSKNDKASTGSSKNDKASTGNSKNDKASTGNSKNDKASTGNSKNDKASTGNSKNDKASTGNSKNDKASTGNSKNDKASTGNSKNDKASIEKSNIEKSNIEKSITDKSSSGSSNIGSSSTEEIIGEGDYSSSYNNSETDFYETDSESYIYYANEGIYIIYSDGSYVFYPNSSGLDVIRDLYYMGYAISEPEENIYAKELVIRNVMGGYPARFDFVENTTCITYIAFEPLMNFRKTTTTAEVLYNASFFVPELPAGNIYQFANIFVGNKGAGQPTFLRNGLVGFKVEKAWIKDNNVNESLVTLQWYNNSCWVPLHTEKVGEYSDYVYFESQTPGYSFFAITEEKGEMSKNGIQPTFSRYLRSSIFYNFSPSILLSCP